MSHRGPFDAGANSAIVALPAAGLVRIVTTAASGGAQASDTTPVLAGGSAPCTVPPP